RITRLHGPFVSDGEVEAVAKFLREQGEPQYVEEVTIAPEEDEEGGGDLLGGEGGNDLYDQAVAVVTRDRKASTSYIQRRLADGADGARGRRRRRQPRRQARDPRRPAAALVVRSDSLQVRFRAGALGERQQLPHKST